MSANTNPVMDCFKNSFDSFDPYGSAVSGMFDICECLARNSVEIPEDWGFKEGAAGVPELGEDTSLFAEELQVMLENGHVRNIIDAGIVLKRYINICKLAGLEY